MNLKKSVFEFKLYLWIVLLLFGLKFILGLFFLNKIQFIIDQNYLEYHGIQGYEKMISS